MHNISSRSKGSQELLQWVLGLHQQQLCRLFMLVWRSWR